MNKLNHEWTYGIVKDGDRKFIAEVYYKELKTKTKLLFYYKIDWKQRLTDWKLIRKDLKLQKKYMTYFEWKDNKLVAVI